MCGGTHIAAVTPDLETGLSPRVRGNLGGADLMDAGVRSIPACAGEPDRSDPRHNRHRVYPRVCGGTLLWALAFVAGVGLSPRVRGNHQDEAVVEGEVRSIPACAGEPFCNAPPPPPPTVYPRVCGGTRGLLPVFLDVRGLSPRVRGNPPGPVAHTNAVRSIPACAGEPAPAYGG